jgi:hypothetical protein
VLLRKEEAFRYNNFFSTRASSINSKNYRSNPVISDDDFLFIDIKFLHNKAFFNFFETDRAIYSSSGFYFLMFCKL